MKDIKDTLIDRRSVRRYEREAIKDEDMKLIHEAIRNTPTSYNGQQFSVIDVTDQDMKLKLYDIIGQKQIKTCSHFLLFLVDYHKISLISERLGVDMPPFNDTVDGLA
ncbi:nitroreductase family protein, partial [Clostridium sp. HCS.1]|uniref:nitroreductase family protein n=1 Tax=Clostridium sp. HCS.1 TaxID=3238594 RepID=UPI003A0FB9A6